MATTVKDWEIELNAVFAGERRNAVVTGDCLEWLPRIPAQYRKIVLVDPSYGYSAYASDHDITCEMLRIVRGWRTLALKGYPQKLYEWLRQSRIKDVAEWIAWCPSNAEAKAGGLGAGLPKWHEDIAICGRVPGRGRLTRERKPCNINRNIQALHRSHSKDYDPTQPARMGDVWTDASPGIAFKASERLHPNEMPVGVALKLVELCTNAGELVIDPCCGSGTIGVACERLGRKYIGIEIVPEWAQLSRDRIEAERRDSTLEALRRNQLPLFGERG